MPRHFNKAMAEFQDQITKQLNIVYDKINELNNFEKDNAKALQNPVSLKDFEDMILGKKDQSDLVNTTRILKVALRTRYGENYDAEQYMTDYAIDFRRNRLANGVQVMMQDMLDLDAGQRKPEAKEALADMLATVHAKIQTEGVITKKTYDHTNPLEVLEHFIHEDPRALDMMTRDYDDKFELLDRFKNCVATTERNTSAILNTKRMAIERSLKVLYMGANKQFSAETESINSDIRKAVNEIESIEKTRDNYVVDYQLRKIKKNVGNDSVVTVSADYVNNKKNDGIDYISKLTGYDLKGLKQINANTCKSVVEKIYLNGENLMNVAGFIFEKHKDEPLKAVEEIGNTLLRSARYMEDRSIQPWLYEINGERPIITVNRNNKFVSIQYDINSVNGDYKRYKDSEMPKKPKKGSEEQNKEYEEALAKYKNTVKADERRLMEIEDINKNSVIMRKALEKYAENTKELRDYVKKEMRSSRTEQYTAVLKQEEAEREAARKAEAKMAKEAEKQKAIDLKEAEEIREREKTAEKEKEDEARRTEEERQAEEARREEEKRKAEELKAKAVAYAKKKFMDEEYERLKKANERKIRDMEEIYNSRKAELDKMKSINDIDSILEKATEERLHLEHYMSLSTSAATDKQINDVNEGIHRHAVTYCDNMNNIQNYLDSVMERYRSGEKGTNDMVLDSNINMVRYMEKRMEYIHADNVKDKKFTGTFAVGSQGEELNANTEAKLKDILKAMQNGTIDGYSESADKHTQLFIEKIKYIPNIQEKLEQRVKAIDAENNMSGFDKFMRSVKNIWTSKEDIEAAKIKSTSDFLKELQTASDREINRTYAEVERDFNKEHEALSAVAVYSAGVREVKQAALNECQAELDKLKGLDLKKAAEEKAKEHMKEIEARAEKMLKERERKEKSKEGSSKRHSHHHSRSTEKTEEEKKIPQKTIKEPSMSKK